MVKLQDYMVIEKVKAVRVTRANYDELVRTFSILSDGRVKDHCRCWLIIGGRGVSLIGNTLFRKNYRKKWTKKI